MEYLEPKEEKIDICDDLILNLTTLEPAWKDGKPCLSMTEDWGLAHQLKKLMKLAKRIMGSTDSHPFGCADDKLGIKRVTMNELAKAVISAFKCDIKGIKKCFQNHEFHPLLDLVIRAADKRYLFRRANHIQVEGGDAASVLADACNDFIRDVTEVGGTKEFKLKVRVFERRAKENFRQFSRYVEAHYRRKARLLWVRLDLWYEDPYLTSVNRDPGTVYRRIKRDWHQLHRDLAQKIFKAHLRGFVWKLEFGVSRSFHLHVVLILDGANLKSDIKLAKIVGDRWKKFVTEGRGGYHNCNAQKFKYGDIGIGEIHRDNMEMRHNLCHRVGGYMTKPDLIVAIQAPDKGRSFGKGKMPR